MSTDPYKYFRVEARELIDSLGKVTLALEKDGGAELVQKLLRLAHTLKGASRVVKQREIADDSHAIEEVLAPYRQSNERVPPAAIEAILKRIDGIAARINVLSAPAAAEPSTGAKPQTLKPTAFEFVHADVAKVDTLLDGLAETHVQLSALRRVTGNIERARRLAELLTEQLAPRTGRERIRLSAEKAASMADDIRTIVQGLERAVGASIDQMDRELRQVRDTAEHLRLVPVGSLFNSLERTVRDSAQALGKSATFEGRGGQVRIDAHVLDAVQAALVQVLRNAVAHGIEHELERRNAGKPPSGRVLVDVVRRGRRVVFRCHDDGRGVDLAAVRGKAVKQGMSLLDAEKLSPDALMRVLLKGGISTSSFVTEVAGRGVGLDVVREAIERLGGEVHIETNRGQGTLFELVVPLSLASIEALSIESAGVLATLPIDSIRRTIRLSHNDVSRTADGESIVYDGTVIPFVALPKALRATQRAGANVKDKAGRSNAAVVVEFSGRMAALGVERLLGTSTVVLRPLPELAPADAIVAGASLDAQGNPQVVLDPEGIVEAANATSSPTEEVKVLRHPILVIDDSLTTRMLEQSILESAGYEVELATSGEEGLETVRKKKYALILVDVEMPGMDGFTFIETIRADPELKSIPAILVTSRAAPEDLERGRRVGANGYIIKSEFDQSDLLARLDRLVG